MSPLTELYTTLSDLAPARVLAVSGGVDSMVLLSLHLRHSGSVYVVHVNHQKRGSASDADEQLIARVCRHNGLPFFCFFYDDGLQSPGNFQQQARRFRYRKLEEIRKTFGADIILTAHHADDNTESLLFQTLRSGHIGDISGIDAAHHTIARPFLDLPKSRLLEYAQATSLSWREDGSNAENAYTRNALRNQLIPLLDDHIPQWADSLSQLSESGRAFHQAVRAVLETITLPDSSGTAPALIRARWLMQPEALQTALLHAWLQQQAGNTALFIRLSRAALQQLSRSLRELQSGRYVAAGGLQIWRERDIFKAVILSGDAPKYDNETALPLEIRPERLPVTVLRPSDQHDGISIRMSRSEWRGSPRAAAGGETHLELRLDALRFPLSLRRWKSGDRIRPLGMKGHQRVSDVLTNKKAAVLTRPDALLLCAADGEALALIWPRPERPGGIIAARAACSEINAPALWLRLSCPP